jgi:hypothetical protein
MVEQRRKEGIRYRTKKKNTNAAHVGTSPTVKNGKKNGPKNQQ